MSRKPIISFAIFLAIGTAWAFNWQSSTAQEQPVSIETTNDSVEVLARGPVHEAFAEPVNLQGFDPFVVEAAPPDPVEELPPDQRPEGDNVDWIPGYWAWDDDLKNFIWISGVWRDIPPGQRWVPGYWSEAEGGWHWTAGFWVSEAAEEIEYLPEPPETLEVGPQIEAPSEDHVWVPGVWQYQETRYIWRPGYWTVVQPGWVWVPARYTRCPTGYVFVNGYWDYPIEERGVLFAPVYYHEPVYRHATYYYTPTVVISTDILTVHLFARPRYCHYYFGDYYAPRYREIGIEPWLMFPRVRGCYDPLFHYYSWHHRRHGRGDWHRTLRDRYEFFARHEHYRPAHTYADLRRQRYDRVRTGDINIDNNIQNVVVQQNNLAVNINQYVQNVERNVRIDGDLGDRRGRMQFARLGDDERRRFVENARDIRGFQQRRSELERDSRDRGRGDRGERSEFARGERGARRSLRIADFQDRQGNRGGGETGDRRGGPGHDRARVAVDVPPTPEQTAAGGVGAPGSAQDATAGAGRDNRRGRSFERPSRADATPDQDAAKDAISGRSRARDRVRGRDSLGRKDTLPGRDAVGDMLGQDDATRDAERARGAIGRRDRGRDSDDGLGRVGRDGPQFPDGRIPDADRGVTTQTPLDASTPPGGASVTDPTGAGTTTNRRREALRRERGTRGDRTPGRGDFDLTDPRNNTGGFPGSRPRDRGALDAQRRMAPTESADLGVAQRNEELRRRLQAMRQQQTDDAQRRAERTRRDAADLQNRQLRGRGENRSQADPLRERDANRDALRSRGQPGDDATRRAVQSQQQNALRRQKEQLRGQERRGRNNSLDQLRTGRSDGGRQRDVAGDPQPRNRQQADRGRSGLDVSRGRGNDRSSFGDAGRRDSDARRRALESIQNQQRQRLESGRQGGEAPAFDPRTRLQRGSQGQGDNDTRRQFSPDARSAFRGRAGGAGGAEASQRLNRGRGGTDASQPTDRGGRGRSGSRHQEQSATDSSRAERGGRTDGEGRRGGGRGGRDRDRDDDD
jgi:hypothetical protein